MSPRRPPGPGRSCPRVSTRRTDAHDPPPPETESLMQTPAPCEYERANTVEDALAALQRLGPGARIVAGGHSLIPMMKLRLAAPSTLVDINDVAELAYLERVGDEIRIGAMTRHVELQRSELLATHFPVFADAEAVIADP